jgi:hypothetical protein
LLVCKRVRPALCRGETESTRVHTNEVIGEQSIDAIAHTAGTGGIATGTIGAATSEGGPGGGGRVSWSGEGGIRTRDGA